MRSRRVFLLGALAGVLLIFSASLCTAQDYRGTEFTLAYPKIPFTTTSVDIGLNEQSFTIYGMEAGDQISGGLGGDGSHGIAAGDLNGDGHEDLVLGAPFADPRDECNAGRVYVLFGPNPWFPDTVRDLAVYDPDVTFIGQGRPNV